MNRPEGITESAWEKAEAAFQQCRDMEAKWSDGTGPEAIARAIQSAVEAERDACALIAEKWKRPQQPIHKQMEVMLPFMVADDIGQQIRSRKGA